MNQALGVSKLIRCKMYLEKANKLYSEACDELSINSKAIFSSANLDDVLKQDENLKLIDKNYLLEFEDENDNTTSVHMLNGCCKSISLNSLFKDIEESFSI